MGVGDLLLRRGGGEGRGGRGGDGGNGKGWRKVDGRVSLPPKPKNQTSPMAERRFCYQLMGQMYILCILCGQR